MKISINLDILNYIIILLIILLIQIYSNKLDYVYLYIYIYLNNKLLFDLFNLLNFF